MTRHLSLTAWYAGIAIAALSCAGTSPRVPQSPVNPVMRASIMPADSAARVLGMHAQRSVSGTNGDYVLGPGDIVAIRAFDFPELNQPVRVEGDGTITLPLLETVPVENCTVAEVQRDLTRRLGNYMYNPHITVFVEEYRSQQVAVVGAVQRPGLVSQTGAKATVLDSLSAAGGVTTEAGSRIFLIPAEGRTANPMQPTPVGLSLYATSPPVGSPADAIMIDTNEADAGLQHAFFSIPVRGGDVIVVPKAGHFIADGWLMQPGTYPVRSGLTLRGAIATAGGLSFPARTNLVRIYRPGANGEITIREVNYDNIVAMKANDVFITEGDVVEVGYTLPKLVPYAFYKVVQDLIRVGAGIKVVP